MIVVDSREQCPFPFIHERYEAKTKQGALTVGDYSLAGLEDKVTLWLASVGSGNGSSVS